MKTQAALTAAAIRKELKEKFPQIKFSVTSDTYSMGDSVNIDYTDGFTSLEVEKVVKKYQYGHFDGMTDMYEYTNNRDDIPQVKYVFVNRHYSDDARATALAEVAEKYGIENVMDEQEWWSRVHDWSSCMVNRHLAYKSLVTLLRKYR